ncbi:hypothetical protein ACFSYG_02405 [Leeuwenhoekiella polynyae]|uniref:Outer membrane beta-barrel porin/alpha-amylase n=1 Tax=Leeuwenhoekiella polynyae TaxID=1550906 RepID=A0A4Q0PHW0_9FLAO|nr:hypothetical protein [Leeuwenhoekiella polynyae]RXG26260.1 hypothetical protein DSM02_254 [Leeuwenhoekiella polynyae]
MKTKLVLLFICFTAYQLQAQDLDRLSQPQPDTTLTETSVRLNPWQQAKGEILISPYISHYVADSYRNSRGTKINFADNGRYSNFNPRVFIAAPLISEKVNLIASIPYFFNKYETNSEFNTNTDFGDIELGLRFHLAKLKNNYLLGSLIGYIPGYENTSPPFAGYDLFALESRLALVGNLPFLGEYNNFHKVELGFRYFFPNDPAQLRFLLSEGYRITSKLVLLGELEGMFSFSENEAFFNTNLQAVADYKMIKASGNMGYEFTPDVALYGGFFHDIYNRNAAIGRGFQLFSVIKIR